MGCASSSHEEAATAIKSVGIDPDVEKVKMLLLGAGDSGKSTIFKQMRLIYGAPRTDDELRMYGVVVRSNIVVTMRKLVLHLRNLGLESSLDRDAAADAGGVTCREAYDTLKAHLVEKTSTTARAPQDGDGEGENGGQAEDWVGQHRLAGLAANDDAKQFLAFHEAIRILWESNTMKKVWAKRSAVDVGDAHKNFLDDVARIAAPEFKPTTQDVIIAHARTTQIVTEKYHIVGADFELYDVGGQRSERLKWIHAFDHVRVVIFVADLSGYDQALAEDKETNRMVEALELFQSVCNNRAFEDTSILLFLNKRDIFEEKIMHTDIAAQNPFCEYTGPAKDYDAGVQYFIQKFKTCLTSTEVNDNFIHVTCATDTANMEFALDSAAMIIKARNKRSFYPRKDGTVRGHI